MQITSAAGRALADSGDAIVSSRRLPDKLFGLLDMHDALSWALPSLQSALAAQQQSRLERLSAGEDPGPVGLGVAIFPILCCVLSVKRCAVVGGR